MSEHLRGKILLFLTLIHPFLPLQADPWGKDSDLAFPTNTTPSCAAHTPFLTPFAETMIKFHQDVISPADGPRSHHKPSSSQYTLEAIHKHGFFLGVSMGCDRLMRENNDPWIYKTVKDSAGDSFKWDPVR